MSIEIERRFLLEGLPGVAPAKTLHIEQAYLNRKPTLRVRQSTEEGKREATFELTYKGAKTGAIGKTEYNLPLNEKAYQHLCAKADGIVLQKRRLLYPLTADEGGGELVAEVDVFAAPYEGLIIAEVEFPSEEAAAAFLPPAWFGEEITGKHKYSNAYLATHASC